MFFVLSSAVGQNKEIPEAFIMFPQSSNVITFEVKYYIDQAYDKIPYGEELIFTFLSKDECKNKNTGCKTTLSKSRADLAYEYLLEKGVMEKDMKRIIVPFDKKKKDAIDYRSFTNQNGEYSILVYKSSDAPTKYAVGEGPVLDPAKEQKFIISPCYEDFVYCSQGTTIRFPENAFYTGCEMASCDTLNISVWEFYSKEDMFNAGLTTLSNRKMLVSGGMIYIKAFCNGRELELRPGMQIDITMPVKYDDNWKVFEGNEKDNVVNWAEDKEGNVGQINGESNIEVPGEYWGENEQMIGILMKSSNLGWINCDLFYEVENTQDLFVQVDRIDEKTTVCMVFHDMKSILPGYYFNADKAIKFEKVPRGKKVTIMAFKKDGNEMLVGYKQLLTGLDNKEGLAMQRMSLKDFELIVKSFN
ncbi:MAG: hypothetical protein A2W91_09570 [Bacteroidetes bacterium GWF2_38_335]|nr:MAG: hypothetical protein A2W91_09570 [Bacteroidetes bacterium GWF2_38_335]OFY80780.1 MAG: hypothetical protein A2281_09375 [Bacteroidetes bacterium RIFOXYA12_FULL_38_20]